MSQLSEITTVVSHACWRLIPAWTALLVATLGEVMVIGSLAADEAVSFVEDVLPILESKCIACHGPQKQEGNLRLDSRAAALAGGDRGPAVEPGNVDRSLLVQAISFRDLDLQMPPEQQLSDREIATLTRWVRAGAEWPSPVVVLFEDEPQFLAALTSGTGKGRLVGESPFAGVASLGMTPLQRDAVSIPGWRFAIREKPQPGEYRFLRLAWKKRGAGSIMVELAADGRWPDAAAAQGRYVAGPNTTGWAAISVSEHAPGDWTVATFDLWQDIGDFTLTGIAPTCDRGEEAFFDSIILAPTVPSLDAYRPDFAISSGETSVVGDAFTDQRNPIRRLFRGERLDLWSLRHPAVEQSGDTPADHADVIDAFIRARLENENLNLSPEADRRTLIRRLTFELTGLPPTPEEVATFLADTSPRAYQLLVERLLTSPRYGERQARLWLDVVRYADTNGYERDEFRPLIWQYRDYVIRSFNQDKPFDRFLREQLAGDHLVSGVPRTAAEADTLIATGYLRLGQWDSTASIFQEEDRLRAEMLADVTNTTAAAFLGLTFSCCQCHDHKYDPFSQADHFRLRAFFAGMNARDDLPVTPAQEQSEIDVHNADLDRQAASLQAELEKTEPGNTQRRDQLTAQLNEIEARRRHPRLAMGVSQSDAPEAIFVLYQGDFASPREAVQPGIPTVLGSGPAVESSRRLVLADWIASPDNPWTARVIVNRIWQQHFGAGLVATPNDFGYSGARPTHPELLDWLAMEFVRRGWSIKEMHRLIVMSAAYRQSSRESLRGSELDPANHLLRRQNVRRLDAETLRDSLLAVSGLLQPTDVGEPVWPPVPEELLHAQPAILEAIEGKDGGRMQGWYADAIDDTDVRSIFLVRKRCLPIPFLQTFDLPDTTVSCAQRDTTVVAPQALLLLNSPEAVRCGNALAEQLHGNQPLSFTDADQTRQLIDALFRKTLQRNASLEEQSLAAELLQRHRDHHSMATAPEQAEKRAFADLCRAVLNLNEFLYID